MGKHDRDLKPEDLINEPLFLLGRHVRGRTFQFDQDAVFLNARPDYVLWRLFFQTRPPLENAVDGCPPSPECAIKQLIRAAGLDPKVRINNVIKWTCYGLTAQFLQFAFSSYRDDRATRRIKGIRPTDEDRFTDDQIARLLKKFHDPHNKRVKEAKLWLDDQYDAEKGWILVLGACAIIRATLAGSIDGVIDDDARLLGIIKSVEEKVSSLSRDGKTNTTGVLADIEEAVSKLFPGWQPGFSLPLWSFRKKIDGHTFYSALLPIHPDSYSHWAGEALGFLSKIALLQSTFYEAADRSKARRDRQLAFRLQMSAIQCQEHALRFYDNGLVDRPQSYAKKVSKIREHLIILVDHARTLASYAGATYWEYGLAALYLRYCYGAGGLQSRLDPKRLQCMRINKAIALAGGCQIPSEVASRGLDDLYDDEAADVLFPHQDGLELRTGFLKDQERRRAGIRPRTLYQLIQGEIASEMLAANKRGALSELSYQLGGAREFQSTTEMFRFFSRCSEAVRKRQGEYEALLDQSELVVRSFCGYNRVLDVAHTAKLLRDAGRLAGSFLTTWAGLMLFAERLLELLEHPIGANVEARSFAQEQLVGCLALIDAEQELTLSYDNWLTLHTAAAHCGTVVTRALREELGDLVEASLFRDAAMGLESAAIVGRRARSGLTVSDTHTLLDEYNRRLPYRTALVHITMVSPTSIKLLASGLRRDRILSWRQAEVRLPLGDKEGWEAVAEEAIDWPWFSNKGVLFSGDDLPSANELGLLWASIDSLAQQVCDGNAKHVVLVPDAVLGALPWQAIALRLGPRTNVQISLLPGVGWFSAHSGDELFHERGLLLWAADAPTPTVDCDIRPELARRFLGREVTSFEYPQVAYLDNKSTEGGAVSLAVIVGHGQYDEADRLADATTVSSFEGWHSVRQKRVCMLLSCHTGAGTHDGLRDYIGLPTYLLRKAKVILAPPVEIPYTAAKVLALEMARSIGDSMERGNPVSILDVYRNAMASNESVSLFNLWGLAFQTVVWHSRG